MIKKKFLFGLVGAFVSLFVSPSWATDLPSGYTQLEYIESTGTQYITTDVIANQLTSAEIKIVSTEGPYSSNAIFGARTDKTQNAFNVWLPLSGKTFFGANISSKGAITSPVSGVAGEAYTIFLSSSRFSVNGTVIDIENTQNFSTPSGLQVFNIAGGATAVSHSSTAANRIFTGRVYYFKVWQDNEQVLNLVPAKNASGVVGMYDTVGGRFYENAGTGEFVAGPIVCNGTMVEQANLLDLDTTILKTAGADSNSGGFPYGNYSNCYNVFFRVEPNTTYTYTATTSGDRQGIYEYNSIVNPDEYTPDNRLMPDRVIKAGGSSGLTTDTFTTGANAKMVMLYLTNNSGSAPTGVQIYPTDRPVGTVYCDSTTPIKIATTKFVESQFSPIDTALASAVAAVNTVVTQTINQAASIATLHANKQTRPADDSECPVGRKCLLVTDENDVPHWYEIIESLSILPDGYTQLEYIESTGTQYINTGYVLDENDEVTVDYVVTNLSATGDKFIMGSQTDGTNGTWVETYGTSNRWYVRFGSAASVNVESTRQQLSGTFTLKKGAFLVNGTSLLAPEYATMPPNPLTLFGRFSPQGVMTGGYVRISKVVIKRSDSIIRNFIPVKNAGGESGMYDTVSGTFFANAGTGSFVAGPVVE